MARNMVLTYLHFRILEFPLMKTKILWTWPCLGVAMVDGCEILHHLTYMFFPLFIGFQPSRWCRKYMENIWKYEVFLPNMFDRDFWHMDIYIWKIHKGGVKHIFDEDIRNIWKTHWKQYVNIGILCNVKQTNMVVLLVFHWNDNQCSWVNYNNFTAS
jgi:hypothetical protein